MLRSSRALLLFAIAVAFAATGCDSGTPPNETDDGGPTTVQFADDALSALEAETPTVELPVEISNPAGREVSAEVLVALGASGEGFSLADLGITDPDGDRLFTDGGDTTAYVLGTVTFPPDAEDGDIQTVPVSIADSVEEAQESTVFALQSARSDGGSVGIGGARELTLTIQAEGTATLIEEDFADENGEGELGVFTAFSVASSENWEPSTAGGADNVPYAVANGFGASEPSNDWLISPAIDFSSIAAETLTFLNEKGFDDSGLDRGLSVLVSTDYDGESNPEDFTWTDVSDRVDNFDDTGDFDDFNPSGEVDLSDQQFQSASVYIAFRYLSSGTGPGTTESWEVDDIVLTGRGGG